jgi:hypothetical protein
MPRKWIGNLANLSSAQEMEEFTMLFMVLEDVPLSYQPDKITWKWTHAVIYSVVSAYDCQFIGTMQSLESPNCH